MSCERCEGRWCGAECFAYKQGKAEERNRIADALELKASTASMEKKYSIAIAFRTFAERLRKGEV